MKLPGSRPDILRTRSLSGPSPVGGAFGGTDSQNVMTLDDFELQAAHYNMACAHARLGNLDDVSLLVVELRCWRIGTGGGWITINSFLTRKYVYLVLHIICFESGHFQFGQGF